MLRALPFIGITLVIAYYAYKTTYIGFAIVTVAIPILLLLAIVTIPIVLYCLGAALLEWMGVTSDEKEVVKQNPEAVHLTMEPAGFCLQCGQDSLWATILKEQGQEERNLQCTWCDLPAEQRTTRSDRMMDS